jgi:MarR family transcriptional regulator, transcriptional regulator for hemolysin
MLGDMPPPVRPPVGLQLTRAAKTVSRAFDGALAATGGSLPVWLVLLSLKTGRVASQRELADAVGIREATLTHHLNSMDARGLVTRERDPANRRVHRLALTADGEAMFHRLRTAAVAFDKRLRRGLSAEDVTALEDLLARLESNAASAEPTVGAGGSLPRSARDHDLGAPATT